VNQELKFFISINQMSEGGVTPMVVCEPNSVSMEQI
jgi:hypothetical protein